MLGALECWDVVVAGALSAGVAVVVAEAFEVGAVVVVLGALECWDVVVAGALAAGVATVIAIFFEAGPVVVVAGALLVAGVAVVDAEAFEVGAAIVVAGSSLEEAVVVVGDLAVVGLFFVPSLFFIRFSVHSSVVDTFCWLALSLSM